MEDIIPGGMVVVIREGIIINEMVVTTIVIINDHIVHENALKTEDTLYY